MTKLIAALDGLKDNPLALALVLINVLFLLWGYHTLSAFAEAGARRDAMIERVIERCKS